MPRRWCPGTGCAMRLPGAAEQPTVLTGSATHCLFLCRDHRDHRAPLLCQWRSPCIPGLQWPRSWPSSNFFAAHACRCELRSDWRIHHIATDSIAAGPAIRSCSCHRHQLRLRQQHHQAPPPTTHSTAGDWRCGSPWGAPNATRRASTTPGITGSASTVPKH